MFILARTRNTLRLDIPWRKNTLAVCCSASGWFSTFFSSFAFSAFFFSFSARIFGFPFMMTGKRFTRYLDFSLLRGRSFPDGLDDATSAPLRAGCLATSGLGKAENGYPVVFKSRILDARMIARGAAVLYPWAMAMVGRWRTVEEVVCASASEMARVWWCALASSPRQADQLTIIYIRAIRNRSSTNPGTRMEELPQRRRGSRHIKQKLRGVEVWCFGEKGVGTRTRNGVGEIRDG